MSTPQRSPRRLHSALLLCLSLPVATSIAALTLEREALADDLTAAPEKSPPKGAPMGYAELPPKEAREPWTNEPAAAPRENRDEAARAPKPKEREPSPFAFDLAAAAEAPIMLGGQATLEVPYRFLFQGEVGVMPGFAVDAVDSALVGAGAYDQTTSDLVRNGLRGSIVGRLSAGWRPFADHGFEILGGYTIASFGGGVSARQAVEAAAGTSLPAQIPDSDIVVHTTIHCFHVSLGWRWVIADHFLIRTSIGYMQAVGSSSHVDVPDALAGNATVTNAVAAANQVLDAKLDDIYKTYAKLPVLGLSLGYRF